MCRFLLLFAIAIPAVLGEKVRFDNYKVYRIVPETKKQLKLLRTIENSGMGLPFWKTSGRIHDPSDLMVPPHQYHFFHDIVDGANLKATLIIKNVQELADHEDYHSYFRSDRPFDWTTYYPLEKIYDWLDLLAYQNGDRVRVVTAGKTYEGREIKGIEITNSENLPGIILESGIHAREWIAPAASSWIVNEIINSDCSSIWRQFNYLYFPVANPDGYVYTWEKDRLWRKTRVPHKYSGVTCYGADPNRNWGFHWMEAGASSFPCHETYGGPKPFSEPEVKNLANYLTSVSSKYDIYISFHSYSQLLLYPWGFTNVSSPLTDTWQRIGEAAAHDLWAVHGARFKVGNTYDTVYESSGGSVDWYHGMFNSTLAYTFELRGERDGVYGFELPAQYIIPSGEELLKAIERMAIEYQKLPPKAKK